MGNAFSANTLTSANAHISPHIITKIPPKYSKITCTNVKSLTRF